MWRWLAHLRVFVEHLRSVHRRVVHEAMRVERMRAAEQRRQRATDAWAVEHLAELWNGGYNVIAQTASATPAIKELLASLMNQRVRVAELVVHVHHKEAAGDKLPHLGVREQLDSRRL